MSVYFMNNIFQENDIDVLLDILFKFPLKDEFLYFEFGYSYNDEFTCEDIEYFEDEVCRIWFRPDDKKAAQLIFDHDFLLNCIILTRDKDMESCKYRLQVVESPESIELMVRETVEGDFQELLKGKLKPFLEQGVKVLTEDTYYKMINELISNERVLNYGNLTERLIESVPQLSSYYEQEMAWLVEDLPHVIFGTVVTPFIIQSVKEGEDISNLFNFLEEMAWADEEVEEVLVVSVLESLITERDIVDTAKFLMGETTRRICEKIERGYGYLL